MHDDCRVVVFAAPDDRHALRDVLVAQLDLHPTDAMVQVHTLPGILPDPLTTEGARQLAGEISALGLHVEVIAADGLPDFDHGDPLHQARCLDEGFEVLEARDSPPCLIPWFDIQLISAGETPEGTRRRLLPGRLSVGPQRYTPESIEADLPWGPELWIVRRNPLHGYRIDHKEMNYEHLGAGKTASATHNFRIFLEDLVDHLPGAYLPPATHALLDHAPAGQFRFDTSEQLKRYTVFHLLLQQRLRSS